MSKENEILGCFVSTTMGDDEGDKFNDYIWGKAGICAPLKILNRETYGKDIRLILFQFYVNPIPYLLQQLLIAL